MLDRVASHLNSEDYIDQIAEEMIANGASKEEADNVSRAMQSYMNAILTDYKEAEKKYEDQIVEYLKGDNPDKATLSWSELGETLASTTLLTGATGIGGTISTAAQGNAIKETRGLDYVKGMADKLKLYDVDNSTQGEVASDYLAEGKDLSGTQVYEIASKAENIRQEAVERREAKDQAAQRKMKSENLLVQPKQLNEDGSYSLGEVTDSAYDAYVAEALDYMEKSGMDVSGLDAGAIADAYGAYMTGTINEDQMAVVNTDNPAAMTLFSDLGDVNLQSAVVKDRNGNINIPKTNIAMENALYAKAADHYVGYARLEQNNWNDTARGEMAEALSPKVGGKGDVAIQSALDNVDPRDRGKFMLTAQAANRVYEYARNTNDNWSDVKAHFKDQFKGVDVSSMQAVFDSAKADKAVAEEKYYGKKVNKNKLTDETVVVPGKFTNESERVLKNSELSTLSSAANTLGLNVIMTDKLDAKENGRYDPNTRTIMLNSQNTMDENLDAIFSHEVTHHLAAYAPDEYMKLSRLVMDRWYKNDEEGFKKAIGDIQKRYMDVKGQELSPEQALEEIIADNAIEFWSDENFAEDVCSEEPSLAKAIINAIKDILSKLRAILSSGNITDEQTSNYLFDQIGVYDATYKMYMNAYAQARQDAADQAVNDWQDAVNAESEEVRHSLSNYTEKQYNNYGWAKANNVLTDKEYASWNEQIKTPEELKAHNKAFDGAYIIPTGDKEGVKNKLVYTKGTKAAPRITKVVKFDVDVNTDSDIETYLDNIRRLIYDQEQYDKNAVESVQRAFGEGFITSVERKDTKSFSEYSGRRERDRSGAYYSDDEYNAREGSFGEPVKRYTPEEYASLLKEKFDEYTTDKEDLEIATAALGDLQDVRMSISEPSNRDVSGRWSRELQVRTIAKGITSSLVNEGYIDFRGQKVNNPEDLAKLCQVLRDPRFETFIVTELTPEQRKVANKLQELMATKMAEWGNEASMNVIGIRLFEDPDYFPIRSDKAGLIKDLDPNQFEQAIRNFGFAKAVKPGAKNAIMIDDIFDVVTEHCNNMNLYNSYTEAMNDFMKVYNYREAREEGEYTVEQALRHAFSDKAPIFIMQFIRDLNGNVSGRQTGIESLYNALLANAKKSSVFVNARVAAQQPTAIARAFYVIDSKYIKGIKVSPGVMKEMFEHCPIALWKSWGYYDINMGKSIDDVIMNNGRWLEDKATDLYGILDNVTWTAIWQMVKVEMKDTHPDVKVGTDEYWNLCNERMSEIVDLTQVVDSPMHRSHAMRDKSFFKKLTTAFMAEPTLTFNMLRDGLDRSKKARKRGNVRLATGIFIRTLSVYLLQCTMVAGAQALVDAFRYKNSGDDDDDESRIHLFWVNFVENWKDEFNPLGKIYGIKDAKSIMGGWENRNLALQGVYYLSLGLRQLQGDPYARSKNSWWENIAYGLGYLTGVPVKTMMTGISNAMKTAGIESPVLSSYAEFLDNLSMEDDSSEVDGSTAAGKLLKIWDGDGFKLTDIITRSKKEASDSSIPEPDDISEDEIQQAKDDEQKLIKIAKSAKKHEGDSEALWDAVSDGYTKKIQEADYEYIDQIKDIYLENGGDEELFDAKVFEASKKALKKSISYDQTLDDIWVQDSIKAYLTKNGMTESEISQIAYKSDAARDLKVALKLGDEDLIRESLQPLIEAGLTREDFDRLWENRNRMDMTSYKATGRYKDKLKSRGNFIWPTNGTITSHFGYRNAPTAGASSNHPAIDIGAPKGTAVVAADGGTVVYAGSNGGYGNSVGIKHDNGMVTYYNHLSAWNVKEGDTVAQGQQIAQVGSTGISTGPHLDFKILDANGNPVDPEKYLN